MHTFYVSDLSPNNIKLDEDESKHAIRVLRLVIGSEVILVDGKGTRAIAVVNEDHPKDVHWKYKLAKKKNQIVHTNYTLQLPQLKILTD